MIRRVRSRWAQVALVCAKCEKKLHGGFGEEGGAPLSKLLRKRARGKGRKADFGVISTRCLKLCPKGAVTLIDGARPDAWLVIDAGTPIDEVAAALELDFAPRLRHSRLRGHDGDDRASEGDSDR